MRFKEFSSGVLIQTTEIEHDLLERINTKGKIARSELSEFEGEQARQMVNRGLISRLRIEDKLYYTSNVKEKENNNDPSNSQ